MEFSGHSLSSKREVQYCPKIRDIPAAYMGRKIVLLIGVGITALLIPVLYEGYYVLVAVSAFVLGIYLLFRKNYGLMYWFQIREN